MTEATKSTKTMEITRALSVLKQIEKEIKEYFTSVPRIMLGVKYGTEDNAADKTRTGHTNYPVLPQLLSKIQGDVDGLQNLQRRQFEIKSKILASNAVTRVDINGKSVTVAEAIFMKSLVPQRKEALNKIRSHVNDMMTQFNKLERDFKTNVAEREAKIKTTEQVDILEVLKAELAAHLKINTPGIVDPMKIHELIEREQQEINDLETQLDYTLSLSNTRTTIEVQE